MSWLEDELQRKRKQVLRVFNASTPAPKKPPKPAVKPPQQSFFNKVRDQFDANTAADQYRRTQQGREAVVKNPGNILTKTADMISQPLRPFAEGLVYRFSDADDKLQAAADRSIKVNSDALETYNRLYKQGKMSKPTYQKALSTINFGDANDINAQIQTQADKSRFLGSAGQVAAAPFALAGFGGKTIAAKVAGETGIGGGYGGLNEVSANKDPTLKGAALNVGIGAASGAGAPILGSIIRKIAKAKTPQAVKQAFKGEDLPNEYAELLSREQDPKAIQAIITAAREAEQEGADLGAISANKQSDQEVTPKDGTPARKDVTVNGRTDSLGNILKENSARVSKKAGDDEASKVGQIYNEGLNQKVIAIQDLRTDKSKEGLNIIGDVFTPKNGEPQLEIYTVDHTPKTLADKAAKEAEVQAKLAALDTPPATQAEALEQAVVQAADAPVVAANPEAATAAIQADDVARAADNAQPTPAAVSEVPGATDDLAGYVANAADASKARYAPISKVDQVKAAWDPNYRAIQIDERFAKSQDEKLRNLTKTESLEALMQNADNSKQIATAYIKDSNIAKTIQKYKDDEVGFNTYSLFMRDLEQRAAGRPPMFRELSDEQMDTFVKQYELDHPEARQDLVALVEDIQAVQDLTVNSPDARYLDPAELEAARTKPDGTKFQFYTPAERATADETQRAAINIKNSGTLSRQKVLQEFTGSDIPLDPSFDRLTNYVETIFKQLGQSRVVKKYAERVEQGLVPDAKFLRTGEESARLKQLKQSLTELREISSTTKSQVGKLRMKGGEAGRVAKTSQRAIANRAREILRQTVDDVDAAAAIADLPDQDLMDIVKLANEPDLRSTPNVKRLYENFVKKSETHARIMDDLQNQKLKLEASENAKKGLSKEVAELRVDATGRQTINGLDTNGNPFKIEVPPQDAVMLQGLDKEKLNAALALAGKAQQPFRQAFTGILNPGFQLAQATFNAAMAPITSPQGLRVFSPRAVKAALGSIFGNGEFSKSLNAAGATRYGGDLHKLADDTTAQTIAAQADTLSRLEWYKNPKRAWQAFSSMGGKLDQMARTSIGRAAYDARIRASGTPEQAIADAVYAYDNYLPNFSNLSSLVSGADKLLMYVGPSQAGTRTLFRTIKRDPWGTSGKLGAAGLAMTGFAGYNLSQDQGKAFYDDMREAGKQYILDNNTVIVLPGAKKNNQTGEWTGIIKIPLPPELRPVNRAVHEAMYDGQPGVPTKQLALAAFDFVTGQSRTLSNPAIQVGSSLVGGKDIRTGRDIIDPSMTEEEKRAARIKYLQYSTGVVGQSTVSDGDGLGKFVKSITDRAYGAKGLSTGGRYYKDEGESIKEIGLNENERKAYQSVVAPRSKDLAGNTIKEKTYYDQSAKAETWLKYPKTFDVSKRMDQKRRERGEPGDPLFELDEQQRKVVLNLMSNASPGNKEDKALTKLNPWLKDFYKQRGDYFDAVKSTLTPEKQKEMGIDPKGITIPQATPELQAKMDSSAKMDSKTKRQFYVDNPDVSDFLAQQGAYQRIKRDYMGLPQFDEYPKPDDATQKVMDEYNKLPKGNGPPKRDGTPSSPNRSAWIKSHPNEWAAMSGAFDKIAAWTAAEEGSLAVYEGLNAEGELDGTPLTDNGGGGGGSFGFGGKTYQYDANGNIVEDATRKRSYFSAMEPGKLDLSYPEPKNTKLSVTPFKIKAPARPSNNKRLRLKI